MTKKDDRTHRWHTKRPYASNSFNEDEVEFLAQLVRTVARGGDARVLLKGKVAAKVHAKVLRMKTRLQEKK